MGWNTRKGNTCLALLQECKTFFCRFLMKNSKRSHEITQPCHSFPSGQAETSADGELMTSVRIELRMDTKHNSVCCQKWKSWSMDLVDELKFSAGLSYLSSCNIEPGKFLSEEEVSFKLFYTLLILPLSGKLRDFDLRSCTATVRMFCMRIECKY